MCIDVFLRAILFHFAFVDVGKLLIFTSPHFLDSPTSLRDLTSSAC